MSVIYLVTTAGIQSEYEESQLRLMWEQGLIEKGTLYWKEGMAEWRPLTEYFRAAVPTIASPLRSPAPKPRFAYTKDPKSLTTFLLVMFWISLGFDILSIASDFSELSLLDRKFTRAEATANDERQGLIGIGSIGISIVSGIAFLMWIYRANLNCRGFGAQDMEFTPGWSVGWFFVPFMNLVKPYQAMKEIAQVSQNPTQWKLSPGSALVGWWWALWLTASVLGQIIFRTAMNAKTIDQLKTSTGLSIFSSIVGIILCLVVIALVKSIAAMQDRVVKNG